MPRWQDFAQVIFGGPVILVIFLVLMHYRAKARRERLQSENIAQLLAAGKDVPLELLRGDEASSAVAEDNLRKGVKNIGIGTGLLIFLTLFLGIGIGSVGFIIIGLGISQLVVDVRVRRSGNGRYRHRLFRDRRQHRRCLGHRRLGLRRRNV